MPPELRLLPLWVPEVEVNAGPDEPDLLLGYELAPVLDVHAVPDQRQVTELSDV